MEEKKVKPWNILAITFTNKAAGEMRERVDKLVGDAAGKVWVSTFHSACVRILRRDIGWIGFDTNFAIYDLLPVPNGFFPPLSSECFCCG